MFDSEKSKQRAKIVLQQLQKHTNESLRSLALIIETLVKTANSLYTEDYRNSVMNQIFIRCLDNELKTAALKKHANHKQKIKVISKDKSNLHTTDQQKYTNLQHHGFKNDIKVNTNSQHFNNTKIEELDDFKNSSNYEAMWEIAIDKWTRNWSFYRERLTDSILEKFGMKEKSDKQT